MVHIPRKTLTENYDICCLFETVNVHNTTLHDGVLFCGTHGCLFFAQYIKLSQESCKSHTIEATVYQEVLFCLTKIILYSFITLIELDDCCHSACLNFGDAQFHKVVVSQGGQKETMLTWVFYSLPTGY